MTSVFKTEQCDKSFVGYLRRKGEMETVQPGRFEQTGQSDSQPRPAVGLDLLEHNSAYSCIRLRSRAIDTHSMTLGDVGAQTQLLR